MNRGRPVAAIARFARWQLQSRLNDEVILDWLGGGAKLAVRRGMTGATGNVYCGLHEYVDMTFVLDTLTANDTFLDIGANVGSYTVLASKVCGARTIAFEPDPQTVNFLTRNIEVNCIGDRVAVIQAALGAESGAINFTRGRDTVNRVARSNEADTQTVPMVRLDDALEGREPALIKMDVEGYEAEVLKGAAKTLASQNLKALIVETVDAEVEDILRAAGFRKKYYNTSEKTLQDEEFIPSKNSIMVRD